MIPSRARLLYRAMLVILLTGIALWARTNGSVKTPDQSTAATRAQAATGDELAQRPGTCQVAPPQIHVPIGEWTATETILITTSVDACTGEQLVRPMDFRRRCDADHCKTHLYSVDYYGAAVADVVPAGEERYLATFKPTFVPCAHRPGEDAGTDRDYGTITLWWSPDKQTLHGLGRDYQVGPCGSGPVETSSYEVKRTNPTAKPLAEGP